MADYVGKVVAISGAASGIGRCFAHRFAEMGARLSLADLNEAGLMEVAEQLRAQGAEVVATKIDVTFLEDMQKFADISFDICGCVDYLFNCAGVSASGEVTEAYMKDFDWVFAADTFSMVYAAKTFVKRMVEQDRECHIINTLSIAALVPLQGMQPYAASKVAGLSISQSLEWQLRDQGSKVKVHCLCPGFVATNFGDTEDYRPPQYGLDDEGIELKKSRSQVKLMRAGKRLVGGGIPVDECVDIAIKAMEDGVFVIHTHPQALPFIRKWWSNLLDGNPGYTDNPLDISTWMK